MKFSQVKLFVILGAVFLLFSFSSPIFACQTLDACINTLIQVSAPGPGINEKEQKIAKSIQAYEAKAIPLLLNLLKHENHEVVDLASYTLRDIKGLDESHLNALLIAARMKGNGWLPVPIMRIGTPRAIEFLVNELKKERKNHTQLTIAMTKLGKKAVPYLIPVFACDKSCDQILLMTVTSILTKISNEDPSVEEAFNLILVDDKYPVLSRAAAFIGLVSIERNEMNDEVLQSNLGEDQAVIYQSAMKMALTEPDDNKNLIQTLIKYSLDLRQENMQKFIPESDVSRYWIKDKFSGCGVWTENLTTNDFIWAGKCIDGKAHGSGIIQYYESGEPSKQYIGEMKSGKRNGTGVLTGKWGERYEGEWLNNKQHGKGKSIDRNRQTYEGEWRNGLYHGFGVLTAGKSFRYEGQWLNGKRHGRGIEISYGDHYTGEFKNNLKDGKGTMIWSDGTRYEGSWSEDYVSGTGQLTYTNGDVYSGVFENNTLAGQGIYSNKDGDRYEGQFKNQTFTGFGVMEYSNGDRYEGEWQTNNPHGKGTYTYTDGSYIEGYWVRGKYIGSTSQPSAHIHTIVELSTRYSPPGYLGSISYRPTEQEMEFFDRLPERCYITVDNHPGIPSEFTMTDFDGEYVSWFGIIRSIERGTDGSINKLLLENKYSQGLRDAHIQTVSIYGGGDFYADMTTGVKNIVPLMLARVYGVANIRENSNPVIKAEYVRIWPWFMFNFSELGTDKGNPDWKKRLNLLDKTVYSSSGDLDYYIDRLGPTREELELIKNYHHQHDIEWDEGNFGWQLMGPE